MVTVRVLVLSKYPIVRTALRHMLASAAIEIAGEAATSDNVAENIRKWRPDVVLLETVDASDPQVTRAISQVAGAGVRLVILAGQGDPSAIRAMMRAGVTGYVLKNSSDTELLLALRSASLGRRFLDSSLIDAIAFEDLTTIPRSHSQSLSKRQNQVLRYIVHGYTSGEIARELGVSAKTVETYRSRIYEKLEVHSRAGLMRYAMAEGLISIRDGVGDSPENHAKT